MPLLESPIENAKCDFPQQAGGSSSDPTADNPFELLVDPAQLGCLLAIVIGILVVTGTIANYTIYHVAPSVEHNLARAMQRLDLGHEPSIPAWYSSLALVSSSGLLAVIAVVKRRRKQPFVAHWFGLAALLFLMGLDEAVMIHEMVDTVLHNWLHTSGLLYFAWEIPAAVAVLVVGVTYINFLRHLDARSRWLFILSGIIFVAGALGMELVASLIFTTGTGAESLAHTASQAVEESLEMLGIALFIYALLDFIGRDIGRLVIRIAPAGQTR